MRSTTAADHRDVRRECLPICRGDVRAPFGHARIQLLLLDANTS